MGASVPLTGTASYDGVFSVAQVVERFPGDTDPDFVDPLVGELELNVNFGNDTLSGSADNFFDTDTAVDGNISLENGEIVRDTTGALILADISGELPVAGAQHDIEGGIVATFAGDDAELLSGIVGATADDIFELFGVIVAED